MKSGRRRKECIPVARIPDALRARLDALWQKRHEREQQFAQVVNLLQVMCLEESDVRKLRFLSTLTNELVDIERVNDDDVRMFVGRLTRGGFDVMKGLR